MPQTKPIQARKRGERGPRYSQVVHKECFQKYLNGKLLTDIANETNVPLNTLNGWSSKGRWREHRQQHKQTQGQCWAKEALLQTKLLPTVKPTESKSPATAKPARVEMTTEQVAIPEPMPAGDFVSHSIHISELLLSRVRGYALDPDVELPDVALAAQALKTIVGVGRQAHRLDENGTLGLIVLDRCAQVRPETVIDVVPEPVPAIASLSSGNGTGTSIPQTGHDVEHQQVAVATAPGLYVDYMQVPDPVPDQDPAVNPQPRPDPAVAQVDAGFDPGL